MGEELSCSVKFIEKQEMLAMRGLRPYVDNSDWREGGRKGGRDSQGGGEGEGEGPPSFRGEGGRGEGGRETGDAEESNSLLFDDCLHCSIVLSCYCHVSFLSHKGCL